MSDIVIRAEGVGKKYVIGHTSQDKNHTLRDVMVGTARSVLRKASDMVRGRPLIQGDRLEDVWALREVAFEVKRGEVLGIIGRNGAGKSTLLKILSRITEPTSGRVEISGRVASLLEVGTGFHPELTGRENIFLNGAILGMGRSEIRRKLDEIVDFAEVETFLDTPVKRYSSGMYMRLAFAVAAHLEPEILIVDEVLAVGDAQFQKKCLGKMGAVAKGGRTVLFVTHNMAAVTQLCDEGLLLESGTVRTRGTAEDAVAAYMSIGTDSTGDLDLTRHVERTGTLETRFTRARLQDERGEVSTDYCLGETVSLLFEIDSLNCPGSLTISIGIVSADGLVISNAVAGDSGFDVPRRNGLQQFRVRFRDVRLYPGRYFVSLWAGNMTGTVTYDWIERVTAFNIVGGGKLAIRPLSKGSGVLFLTPEWENVATVERCA